MDSYITIKEPGRYEYEDRKSVFIGEAAPVSSEKDAILFIESAKKRYPDARHHVYAYVLRENSIMRFSDDREPQGTAGMPVLDVVRKKGIVDLCVVVTRYFGGTLLGTGGLVRAYTSAAQGAVEAGGIIRYDIYATVSVELNYSDYGKVASAFSEFNFRENDIIYAEAVRVEGRILSSDYVGFEKKLTELTSARAKCTLICEKFDF